MKNESIENNEEMIYNPYNERNKNITFQGVKKILNTFDDNGFIVSKKNGYQIK